MNLVELHPELSLDRAESSGLGEQERRQLDEHAARCPACAAHLRWRADVEASVTEELASAAGKEQAQRLVAATLTRRRGAASSVPASDPPAPRPARRALVAAVIVGVCLGAGAATAAMWSARRARPVWQPAAVDQPRTLPRQPSTPTPAPSVAATAPPPRRLALRPRLATTGRASAPAAQPASAAEIFAALTLARQTDRPAAGRLAYQELRARFAGSREEQAGRVLLAALLLRHYDTAGALALYESYLTSDGAGSLAEEARLGRALALDGLGRSGDARRAWREFLDRHPGSINAGRARARLAALGAGGW